MLKTSPHAVPAPPAVNTSAVGSPVINASAVGSQVGRPLLSLAHHQAPPLFGGGGGGVDNTVSHNNIVSNYAQVGPAGTNPGRKEGGLWRGVQLGTEVTERVGGCI